MAGFAADGIELPPRLICSGGNFALTFCATPLAHAIASDSAIAVVNARGMQWRPFAYSGINANVQIELPFDTSGAAILRMTLPPKPEATVTYCTPLCV